MQSMTGFASKEAVMSEVGKCSIDLRSTNHKFLETIFHLPEGLLPLEDKIKKIIGSKIKRGRITCVITITGRKDTSVFLNKPMLKNYISILRKIKKEFNIADKISINTIMQLPGVLSAQENRIFKPGIWPEIKKLFVLAVDDLVKMRRKEGQATSIYLKMRAEALKENLTIIKRRFKRAIKDKIKVMIADEERVAFLKNADISEETERLAYHIGNFKDRLSKTGAIGKELDFIAQEMQREANTLGAKSFDAAISDRVIQIRTLIEKIREQVQNIE